MGPEQPRANEPHPDYMQDAVVVLPEVAELLSEPLDTDNFGNLMKQLARAEAWLGRVSFQYRNAERFLSQAKKTMLMPKSKDYTDMDRTVMLEADTRTQQAQTEILKDYQDALARRLSLGQSIMASQRQEMKSSLR
jgi:superfamily I DNA/RNA helicase